MQRESTTPDNTRDISTTNNTVQNGDAQPIDGKRGASILGPTSPTRQPQDRDLLVAPITDRGTVANLRWPFADSHNHLEPGVQQHS